MTCDFKRRKLIQQIAECENNIQTLESMGFDNGLQSERRRLENFKRKLE